MKNEVYGTIILSVSMETESTTEGLAKLEAGYKVNEYNFEMNKSLLVDVNRLKVHNVNVDWESFYEKDE
ncbi:hypothetical protein [Metabacillus arenae]|uniref:Uncharacterized protein n=1 Tax=Metabacillus arenae TaxID=2771434 RepID=A0A926NCW8_9BACI|nr:hypothetical protein [Metabacillus arenae]MBD1379224.1 hypothetical protein [Metabacillus arenae]